MTQALVPEIEKFAPHAGQMRVIEERRRFNVLMCGRRFGKTILGEFLATECAYEDKQPVGWFAPSYKYLLPVWDQINEQFAPQIKSANKTDRQIKFRGGGVMDFWTMEDTDAGRGRKYRRAVVDEAGIVKRLQEIYQQAIRPTLTDLKGDVWMLGTPKGRNFFHQCFQKGQAQEDGWKSWRFGTAQNPFMDAEEVEGARRDMPPAAFEQEYLGIPADDGANPFGLAAIKSCYCPLSSGAPTVFGVDLAKSQDWVWVIGLDAAGVVCVSERWQSDWKQTRERVTRIVGNAPALIDSTGVGDPIVEDLQRVLPNVEGFKFSSNSKQQIMEGLASAIQRGEVGFPEGILGDELESFEFEYTRGGVRYSAPIGLHDDGVCALALAVRKRTIFGNTLQFSVRAPESGNRMRAVFEDQGWR